MIDRQFSTFQFLGLPPETDVILEASESFETSVSRNDSRSILHWYNHHMSHLTTMIKRVRTLLQSLILISCPVLGSQFSLDIVCPSTFQLVTLSAISLTAPALDLAVDSINEKNPELIKIRATYVYDKRFASCEELTAGVDYLVADYYYRKNGSSNATVFIFPGTTGSIIL